MAPFCGDVEGALETIEAFLGNQRAQPVALRADANGGRKALSQRELDVLRLLAAGLSNAEVARELVVSIGTVKTHTASIYRKLDVDNRTRAVARARECRLLD